MPAAASTSLENSGSIECPNVSAVREPPLLSLPTQPYDHIWPQYILPNWPHTATQTPVAVTSFDISLPGRAPEHRLRHASERRWSCKLNHRSNRGSRPLRILFPRTGRLLRRRPLGRGLPLQSQVGHVGAHRATESKRPAGSPAQCQSSRHHREYVPAATGEVTPPTPPWPPAGRRPAAADLAWPGIP